MGIQKISFMLAIFGLLAMTSYADQIVTERTVTYPDETTQVVTSPPPTKETVESTTPNPPVTTTTKVAARPVVVREEKVVHREPERGVISTAWNFIGTVLALPFRIVATVIEFIF